MIEHRKNIALVSQEPVSIQCASLFVHPLIHYQTLYTATIKFSILLGAIKPAEEVTEDELKAVCRDANILNFIESLPECVFHPPHVFEIANFSPEDLKLRWEVREVS